MGIVAVAGLEGVRRWRGRRRSASATVRITDPAAKTDERSRELAPLESWSRRVSTPQLRTTRNTPPPLEFFPAPQHTEQRAPVFLDAAVLDPTGRARRQLESWSGRVSTPQLRTTRNTPPPWQPGPAPQHTEQRASSVSRGVLLDPLTDRERTDLLEQNAERAWRVKDWSSAERDYREAARRHLAEWRESSIHLDSDALDGARDLYLAASAAQAIGSSGDSLLNEALAVLRDLEANGDRKNAAWTLHASVLNAKAEYLVTDSKSDWGELARFEDMGTATREALRAAKSLHLDAFAAAKKAHATQKAGEALRGLAFAEWILGDDDAAAEHYRAAADAGKAGRDGAAVSLTIAALNGSAGVAFTQGRDDDALRYCAEATKQGTRPVDEGRERTLSELYGATAQIVAQVMEREGDPAAAARHAEQAIAWYRDSDAPERAAESEAILARCASAEEQAEGEREKKTPQSRKRAQTGHTPKRGGT